MRVLLAGATGAIGRYLVPLLVAAGHEVTGVTRHEGALERTPAKELRADIRNRERFLAAVDGHSFDAVIHEVTDLSRTPLHYRDMRETNRLRSEGTSTLIAAARATGATKMVSASIVYGYGFRDHGKRLITEQYPFGQMPGTKLDAVHKALLSLEQQTRAFGGVALRYGLFYKGRGPVPQVASDFDGELPFVHLEDAASATVAALEKAPPGSVYNIVDDEPVSWRELHRARADAFQLPDPLALPTWILRPAAPFGSQLLTETSMRVSNAKAKQELGWTLKYPSFRDALSEGAVLAQHDAS